MRLFVGVFLLLSEGVSAQVISGARFMALANAGVALENVYSLGNNQAGIASLPTAMFAAAFEEHYISSNTRSIAAMAAIPSKLGNLGLYLSRYSLKDSFEESRAGLTYAVLLKSKLALGGTVNYRELSISRYGKNVSLDIGLQYRFSEDWLWGFHLANLFPLSFENKTNSSVPFVVKVGTSYFFSKQVLITMESDYMLSEDYNFRLGLEYMFIDSLYLRGGLSVNPFVQYIGGGIKFRKVRLDAASSFHPHLGVSIQSSLSYVF